MLESFAVHRITFHNVNVELSAEEQVIIHGFGGNFRDLSLSELKEGVAA